MEDLKPLIRKFLNKIGADILKIQFEELSFNKGDFWKLMKVIPKLRELEMNNLYFSMKSDPDNEDFGKFELKHLTKLEIFHSTNLGFLATLVPTSLKILEFFCNWKTRFHAEVLGKQKQLEELSLRDCEIYKFKFDPENCHIKKLTIDSLEFPNDSAFEKFSDFMKIQESVTELWFGTYEKFKSKTYDVIPEHLLGLKTLKKLGINCDYLWDFRHILGPKFSNPALETLIIKWPRRIDDDFKLLPRFFPNVTDLKITGFYFGLYLQSINSMKIKKLEMECMSKEMLTQLELKQLQELHVTQLANFLHQPQNPNDLETVNLEWTIFIDNHSQLKILHLPQCHITVEQLQIALENLPLLESLEVIVSGFNYGFVDNYTKLSDEEFKKQYMKEQAERTAQLIGENYDRFAHWKLQFEYCDKNIEPIILDYLEKHFPDVSLIK